ncbi:MAG: hypothetical protein FJ104_17365 [Deltaproteobacteria bacterium]|nr:hypothetical protein [Deltaproteobacteria bacterium]
MTRAPLAVRAGHFLALLALATGCAGGESKDGAGDCAEATNQPGSRCVPESRLDVSPEDVTLDAELDALGIDFSPPADGFQLRTAGVRLHPGEDDEWCEALVIPEDAASPGREWCVERIEVGIAEGVHHYFVAKAPFGSESEALMTPGERVRCVGGAHVTYGSDLEPIPIGQAKYVDEQLPAGVAVKLTAGQKLSVNYHWLNTTEVDQITTIALNFHATPCDGQAELRQFGFYNQDISVPPNGTWSTEMAAAFTQDVYVSGLFRHTHRFGRDVPIAFAGGPRDGEVIFVSPDYAEGAAFRFPEPVLFRAGEGLSFTCNFENPTKDTIRFGPTADDEMCMLLGTYWQANPAEPPEVQHRYKWN